MRPFIFASSAALLAGLIVSPLSLKWSVRPADNRSLLQGAPAGNDIYNIGYPADVAHAWDVFAQITNATQTGGQPQWIGWDDKCAVGLTNSDVCKISEHKNAKSALKSDLFGMERSFQIEAVQPASTAQLASVLFNSAASVYVSGNHYGDVTILNAKLQELGPHTPDWKGRTLPPPPPVQSKSPIVVKLIWELVLDNKPIYIYDPAYPSLYKQQQDPGRLASLLAWPGYKFSSDSDNCQAGPLSEPDANHSVPMPPSCFYSHKIHLSDDATRKQINADRPNVPNAVGALGKGQAKLILVGFHVMELTAENPSWRWMTFYWTPETNGHADWDVRWQHFHVATTTTDGTDDSSIHTQPVFNPYLEGQSLANGADSNCMSCHSLAAYNPNNLGAMTGAANSYSLSPDRATQKFPQTENAASQGGYFDGALRTSFLWSISTNQIPQPTPTPQSPNAAHVQPKKAH